MSFNWLVVRFDARAARPELGASSQVAEPPPLCPARHPPQSVAACLSRTARRILSRMGTNRARRSTARPSGPQRKKPPAPDARLMRVPVALGTCACSAFRARRSHRPRSAMRQRGLSLSRSEMLGLQHASDRGPGHPAGDRRRHPSMNSNATCGAASAPRSGAIRTSAAIWSRCDRPRFRRVIRLQHGGRASDRSCWTGPTQKFAALFLNDRCERSS